MASRYMHTVSHTNENKNISAVADEDSPSFLVATSQPATAVVGSVYGHFDGTGIYNHLLLNCVNRIEVWETLAVTSPAAAGSSYTFDNISEGIEQDNDYGREGKYNKSFQSRVQEEYQKHHNFSGDVQSNPPVFTLVAQFPVYGTVRHLMAVSLPCSVHDNHDSIGSRNISHFPRLAVLIVTEKQDLSLILLHRQMIHDNKSSKCVPKGCLRHRTLYHTNFTTSLFKQNYNGVVLYSTTSDTAAAAEESNSYCYTDYRKGNNMSSKVTPGTIQSSHISHHHYLLHGRPLVALCYYRCCIILIDIAACIAFGAENHVMGDIVTKSEIFGEQGMSKGNDHNHGTDAKMKKMKNKTSEERTTRNARNVNNNGNVNETNEVNLCDLFGDPAAAGGRPPQQFLLNAPTTDQLGQYLESLHCFSESTIYDIILKVGCMTCPCSFCPLEETEPKSITFHYQTYLTTSTSSSSNNTIITSSSSSMLDKQHLMNYTVSTGLLLVVLHQDHRGRSHVRRYAVQDTLLVPPSHDGPLTEGGALSPRTTSAVGQGFSANTDDGDDNDDTSPAAHSSPSAVPRSGNDSSLQQRQPRSNINSNLYNNINPPTVTSILNRSVLRMTNKPRGVSLGHAFTLQGDVETDATLLYSVPGGILVIGSSLATFLSTEKNGFVITSITPSPFARSTPRLAIRVSPVCTLVGYQNGAVIAVILHEINCGGEGQVVCHVVSPYVTPMVSMTQVGQCCVFLGSAYSNSMFLAWDGATQGIIQKEVKNQEDGYGRMIANYNDGDDDIDLLGLVPKESDSRNNNNNKNRQQSNLSPIVESNASTDPLKAVNIIYNGVSQYIAVENIGPIVDMCVADTSFENAAISNHNHYQQHLQCSHSAPITDAVKIDRQSNNSNALTFCNLSKNENINYKPLSIVAASGVDIFGSLHVLRTAMQLTEEASLYDVCSLVGIHVAGPLFCGTTESGTSHNMSLVALSFDNSTKFLSATSRGHQTGSNNKGITSNTSPAVQLNIEELDFCVEACTLLIKALPSSSGTRGGGSSVILHATSHKASILNVSFSNGTMQMVEAYSVCLLPTGGQKGNTSSIPNSSKQQNERIGSFTTSNGVGCSAFAIDPMYTTLVAATGSSLLLYELPSLELMRCVEFEQQDQIACIDITEKFEVIVGLWSSPYRLMVLSADDMTPRILTELPALPRSIKCTKMKTNYTFDDRAARYIFVGFADGTVGHSEVVGRGDSVNRVGGSGQLGCNNEMEEYTKASDAPVIRLNGQFQQYIVGTTPATLMTIIGQPPADHMNRMKQDRECNDNDRTSAKEEEQQRHNTDMIHQLPECILCCGNNPSVFFESRGSIVSTGFGANAVDLCAQISPSLFITYNRTEHRLSFVSGNSHVKNRINKLTTPVRTTIPRVKYVPEWDMYVVALRERDQDVLRLYGLSKGGDAIVQRGVGGGNGGALHISGVCNSGGCGVGVLPSTSISQPSSPVSSTGPSSTAASTFTLLECERCEFVEWIHLNGPPFEVSPDDDLTRVNTWGGPSSGTDSNHRAAYITSWSKFDFSQPFSALLVGTNFVYPNDETPRNGRILLLAMERADILEPSSSPVAEVDRFHSSSNNTRISSPWSLIQICEKDVQGMLLCACMMPKTNDRVILGISGGVHVFRWSTKEMNFKPEVGIAVGGAVMKVVPLSGSVLGYSAKAEEARARERKKLLDLRRRQGQTSRTSADDNSNREQVAPMGNDAEEEDLLRAAAAHNPAESSPLLNSVRHPFAHLRSSNSEMREVIDTRHVTTGAQEDENRNTRNPNFNNDRGDNDMIVTGRALLSNDLLDSTSALIAVADVRNSITILEINSVDLIRVEAMDLTPREVMDMFPMGNYSHEWNCNSKIPYAYDNIDTVLDKNSEHIEQSETNNLHTTVHPDEPYRPVEPSFYNPQFLVSDTDLNIYVMGADPRHLGLTEKKRRIARRIAAADQAGVRWTNHADHDDGNEQPTGSTAQAINTTTSDTTWQPTRKKKKLVATAQFHIGDRVTVFQRGSFQTSRSVSLSFRSALYNCPHNGANSNSMTMNSFIFGTVHGMLGTVLTIPRFTRNVLSLLSDVILSVINTYRQSKSFGSLDYHLYRDIFRREQLPPNYYLQPCMPLFVENSNSNFYYDEQKTATASNSRNKKQRRLPVPNVDNDGRYDAEEEDGKQLDREGCMLLTTYESGGQQYKVPSNPRKNLHAYSHNNFIDADLLFQFIERDSLCMNEDSGDSKMKKVIRLRMKEENIGIKEPLLSPEIYDEGQKTAFASGRKNKNAVDNNTSITEEFIVMQLNILIARAHGSGALQQGTSIKLIGCGTQKIKTDDGTEQQSIGTLTKERKGNKSGSLKKVKRNLTYEEAEELNEVLLVHGLPCYPFNVADLKAFLYELRRKC